MKRNDLRGRRSQTDALITAFTLFAVALLGIAAVKYPLLVVAMPAGLGFLIAMFRPSLGIYVLMFMLFFLPVTVNMGWPGQTTTYVFYAALALAVGGRLTRFITKAQPIRESIWILLLLVPAAAIGVIHQTSGSDLWLNAKALVVLVVVSWHVTAEAKLQPERLRGIAVMIAWAAPALALLALYQRAVGSWPFLDQYASSVSYTSKGDPSRSAGVMGHPILYGAYCMIAAVVAGALKPKWWKLLMGSALLGLVLSGARSAWVGAAVALVLIVVIYRPKITFWGAYSGLIVACVLLGTFALYPNIANSFVSIATGRIDNVTESASALARNLRVDLAWHQIAASKESWWWGLGPGSLVAYFTRTTLGDNLAATFDNSYLTLWYEYGVVTLVLFSAVMVAVIWRGAVPGRILMLSLAAQIWFFDFYQWPLMIGAVALAAALCIQPRPPACKSMGARDVADPLVERVMQ